MTAATPTKATRTRRDIVQAAIECWAADSSASLGSVADRAGVGRTTVNRYFRGRTELVTAVDDECRKRFAAAVFRARSDEGTGLAALQRVSVELVHLGEMLGLIFADNALVDPDSWEDDAGPSSLGSVVARGRRDGSIASDLPAEWVLIATWTSLFAAWLMMQSSELTLHEVSQLLTRTLANGVAG